MILSREVSSVLREVIATRQNNNYSKMGASAVLTVEEVLPRWLA
jgi:hypothetical protein